MKIITEAKAAADRQAAEEIAALIREKPDAVLALAAGESPKGVYAELRAMCGRGELSFAGVRIFALTEYADLPLEHPQNCRHMLEESLISGIGIKPENCYFLTKDNYAEYDGEISACGGLDLAVLGIGENVHIGFNEPATPFYSFTHIQKLTDRTKRSKAERFGGIDNVPAYGITMGLKTITEARNIILLAYGEEKSAAVYQMVYGKTMTYLPASFLQIPLEVTVYLDTAAASKL